MYKKPEAHKNIHVLQQKSKAHKILKQVNELPYFTYSKAEIYLYKTVYQ